MSGEHPTGGPARGDESRKGIAGEFDEYNGDVVSPNVASAAYLSPLFTGGCGCCRDHIADAHTLNGYLLTAYEIGSGVFEKDLDFTALIADPHQSPTSAQVEVVLNQDFGRTAPNTERLHRVLQIG